jgi:hypothetical protein
VTQSEIRAAVTGGALTKLGVLAAGETAAAADDALASATLDRLVAALGEAGDVGFTADALPEEAQHGLIALLAAELADAFGLPEARARRLDTEAAGARRLFRARGRAGASDPVRFVNH